MVYWMIMKPFLYTLCAAVIALPLLADEIAEKQEKWIAHYEKQKNIPKPSAMLVNEDAEPELTEGFVSLYNGKDLDDWVSIGGACTFEPKGDTIVGVCVKGEASTYLSTKKDDYTDFVFTAELKWAVDGNTGVMFRTKRKETKKGDTVVGPQAEMEGFAKPDRNWSGGLYGQGDGGWIYPLWLKSHEPARKALKKDGWNRITVHAKGDTFKTWINGVPAAHWVSDKYAKGFFSLQVHSGNKGEIHFRNIKVKEL